MKRLLPIAALVLFLDTNPGATPASSVQAAAPGPPTNLTFHSDGPTVTLRWSQPNTMGVATDYVVAAAAVPQGPPIAAIATAETEVTVRDVPLGTYYVRVAARNVDGTSPPSNEIIVSIVPPPCGPPDAPTGLASTVNGLDVGLTWTPPPGGPPPGSPCGATEYVVLAGSQPGFSNVAVVRVPSPVLIAAAPPGTYYVRVVATNLLGSSRPSNEITVTVGPACIVPFAPPLLERTAEGLNVTLQWATPANAAPTSYQLEAGSSSGLSDLAVVQVTGNTFSASAPAGRYFVRVLAVNGCGKSAPSNEVTVTLPASPCALPSAAATPTAMVINTSAFISWPGVDGATSYKLDVGTASGGSNVLSQWLAATGANLFSLATGTYFMRVQTFNDCGAGPVSTEGQFVIGSTCIPPSAPSNVQVSVNASVATLSWLMPASGPPPSQYLVEIGTFPRGSNVVNHYTGPTSTGFVTGPLASGTYYARVIAFTDCGGARSPASNEVVFEIQPASARGGMVISEFRTRGPSGADDEFIELRNASIWAVDIGGWQVAASNSAGATGVRASIPSGVVLQPGCYYLLTNSNTGSYSGAVIGDQPFAVGITDDGGIALLKPPAVVVDAVGLSVGSVYGEGTRLGPFGTTNSDRSLVRTGDTNNNAADFTGGAPGIPQNSSSSCTPPQ